MKSNFRIHYYLLAILDVYESNLIYIEKTILIVFVSVMIEMGLNLDSRFMLIYADEPNCGVTRSPCLGHVTTVANPDECLHALR